jgi:release factor glutamine methyltransferase
VPFHGVPAREAVDSAAVAIGAAGSDTPRLDAELLLAHVLGVDRTQVVLHGDRPVEGPAVRAFQDLVRRRSSGHEPVAYLVGRRGFRRLDLDVDPRVLIPRPETETLVEVGLELPEGARVADVGTGSGAVALALKDERPDLDVVATDVSPDALDVARANAARLGLDVDFRRADLLEGIEDATGPGLDAVLANPPYVAEVDRGSLQREITDHEPALAVFGGEDGLVLSRRLVAQAAATGASLVALETGMGQAPELGQLLAAAGFAVAVRPDLAGIDRVVVGRR